MIRLPNDWEPDRKARRLAVAVTLATAAPTACFSVAELADPKGQLAGDGAQTARQYASYTAARNIVLLGSAVGLAGAGAWRPLGLVLTLNAGVQATDALLGAYRRELPAALIPACFAAALAAAAARLRPTGCSSRRPAARRRPRASSSGAGNRRARSGRVR